VRSLPPHRCRRGGVVVDVVDANQKEFTMTVPIEPISAQLVVDHATMRVPATDAAVDRFNSLMAQQPHEAPRLPENTAQPGNALTQFIGAQEAMMRQTYADVRAFSIAAPGMDVQSMASRSIELNYQVTMVQTQFNAGVYMAQSSKNGLQTLMKNQ
jgi:type III secretion inner rod protein HrpB2